MKILGNMKILGINGGNGVILYPFRRHLMGNIEIRPIFKTPGDAQWKLNFPDIPLVNKESKMIQFETPDVIVGAPNCGHSSILALSRAKKLADPKEDKSFNLFIDSILHYQPKLFMMENLTKMLEMVTLRDWKELLPGYKFIVHDESCMAWGNSQKTRKRLVLIGIRKSAFRKEMPYVLDHFSNIYMVNKPKPFDELVFDLEEEDIQFGHVREDIEEVITMYSGYKLSLKEAQKFWLKNLTTKRWPVYDRKFTTAPGVYRNIEGEFPAVARKANRQFNIMGLQMSPRELARVQGIPDKFKILMDISRKNFYINKARATVTKTPPYEIGRWFYKQLKQLESWK